MSKSYLSLNNNTTSLIKPSRAIFLFLMVLFVGLFGNTVVAQNGPNCPSGVCIGPGGSITSGSLTVTSNAFYSSITVKSGATLTVKSGFTLYVGQVGTAASTEVVDFQNGCTVVIESGASLVVNGLLNNSNNSNGVTIDGSVAVTGNVTAGNGSTIVGAGTLNTTGTIITDSPSGSIFGSTGDCTTGPCFGSSLSCSGSTNTISGNQTICSINTPATLTGSNVDLGASYQWQKSITYGANYVDISGATSYNYSPSLLSTTTYYRRKETFSGCTGSSSQVTIVVNIPPTTANAGLDQSKCNTTTFTLAGNSATTGTGAWSLVSGIATITTPTSNTSGVTGVSAGTSATLRWTISNGVCAASTDDIVLTNNATPTTANAGLDQSKCNTTTFTLAGNSATTGTGVWSVVSGTATITAPTSNTSGVTGVSAGTSATLRWTISNGTCSSIDDVILTNNATPTVAAAGTDQANCNITTFILAGNAPTTGTGIWSVVSGTATITTPSSNTSGVTGVSVGTSATLRWTISNGACTSSTDDVILTNNAIPAAPTVATTQPTCGTTTGTITITAVTGETYSFDSGAYSSTLIYSGLAQGSSHTIYAKNSSGCISTVTNVTINTLSTKTWNGSWSPLGAPTSNDYVIINANYSVSTYGDLNACSLTINSGAKLTIEAGKFIIIQNDLTVNGTLDVLDKGSLVMVNDSGVVTNSGTTTIHRFTTPYNKYDYTYWSTPVVSTNIASTFLGWNTNYSFEYIAANFLDANNDNIDDDGNDWSFVSTMTPGKGYIIMVPTPITGPFGNNPSEVVFSGKVNNGVQKITGVNPAMDYLIGNPFPSALDADSFLNYNSGVLDGTLSFWTHNTAIQLASNIASGSAGSGTYAFTSDDYASYNLVGGVGVGTGVGVVEKPNGKIASGQAFFATSKAAISAPNEIVFNNAMRLSSGGATLDNSQFFKTRSPKTKTVNAVEKHRIWLDLTNTQGAFKQTLVGYVTNATNDYDSRFDGESLDGNQFVDFYSVNQDKNLTIQGRALPFDENDEVSIGFRSAINGDFTINIDETDGLLADQEVFLEDKLANTVFDLKTGNYTFKTVAGTFNDRFVLRYTNKTTSGNKTLGLDETDANDGIIVLYSNNYKTLIIRNNLQDTTVNTVSLFNMSGQNINNWDVQDGNQTSIQIPIKNISPEIYIVKVTTSKGATSKKIIIK